MPFLGTVSLGYLLWLEATQTGRVLTIPLLLALSLAFYALGPIVARRGPVPRRVLALMILSMLTYLAAFKYVPPLIRAAHGDWSFARVAIPIGISYYTFKLIHYAIEVARGN